jgi:hypothetical protein
MDKHQAIWETVRQHEPHGLTYRQVWTTMPRETQVRLREIRATLAGMQEKGLVRFMRGRWRAVLLENKASR